MSTESRDDYDFLRNDYGEARMRCTESTRYRFVVAVYVPAEMDKVQRLEHLRVTASRICDDIEREMSHD